MNSEQSYPQFSFFKAPITNKIPVAKPATIPDIYRGITSIYYSDITLQFRALNDISERRKFKQTSLDFVTFAGTFSQRISTGLIDYSGYMCIDFDHVPADSFDQVKAFLIDSIPLLETQLLFRSPSADGLKWVIAVDVKTYSYELTYRGVVGYLNQNFPKFNEFVGCIDKSGKDVTRACFLCHDREAYVNPKYLLP